MKIMVGIIIKIVFWLVIGYYVYKKQKVVAITYQEGDLNTNTEDVDQLVESQRLALKNARKEVSAAISAHKKAVGTRKKDDDEPAQQALDDARDKELVAEARLIKAEEAARTERLKHHSVDSLHFDRTEFFRTMRNLFNMVQTAIPATVRFVEETLHKIKTRRSR